VFVYRHTLRTLVGLISSARLWHGAVTGARGENSSSFLVYEYTKRTLLLCFPCRNPFLPYVACGADVTESYRRRCAKVVRNDDFDRDDVREMAILTELIDVPRWSEHIATCHGGWR